MAHIFQKMSPGMVTMASTDKNILIYDVSSLKIGIFLYTNLPMDKNVNS